MKIIIDKKVDSEFNYIPYYSDEEGGVIVDIEAWNYQKERFKLVEVDTFLNVRGTMIIDLNYKGQMIDFDLPIPHENWKSYADYVSSPILGKCSFSFDKETIRQKDLNKKIIVESNLKRDEVRILFGELKPFSCYKVSKHLKILVDEESKLKGFEVDIQT